jgi:2-phospho-L-lactate guanylyltransferase (CobY/MobA/RfbA family)
MIKPHVLVPVKALGLAKSRLSLPPDERRVIARALAEHTLRTVAETLGSRYLVVVTADLSVGELAAQTGASVVNDPHDDLNRAVQHGLASITLVEPVLVLDGME